MIRFARTAVLLSSLALIAACGAVGLADTVRGSGVIQKQTRTVSAFSRLRISGSVDVEYTRGKDISVVVEADDNIIPLIDTLVHDDELQVKSHQAYSTSNPVRVIITSPTLRRVQLDGSGSATMKDLSQDAFEARLAGSGALRAAGNCSTLRVDLSGSGEADLARLKSSDASVSLSGSGNINVNASRSLDATLSGSGNIHCTGSPPTVQQHVTGSGTVRVD